MDGSRKDARSSTKHSAFPFSPRFRARVTKKRAVWLPLLLFCLLFGELLGNWSTIIPVAYAAPNQQLSSTPGHNTAQQFLNAGQQSAANQRQFQRPNDHSKDYQINPNDPHNQPLPSSEPATMQDLVYTLDDSFVLHRPVSSTSQQPAKVRGTAIPAGTGAFQIKGSDGRLEVDLARSSLDFAQAKLADGSAPIGQLLFQLHQITGHFIEASSILGTYQIQIVDSQGNVIQGVVLIQPLTVIYHYQRWEMSDLDIDPSQVHLSWTTLLANAEAANQSTTGLVMPMAADTSTQTLTAQSNVVGGVVALSSTPTIATPSKPDLFEASGNGGQYSHSYPLTVVPGPGGFQPHLALSYSSMSTNSRYSRISPASDEGEGWSLSLGSISSSTSDSTSTGGAQTWYSINGVDGISDKLLPSPANQTTPTTYETEHISHLLIKHLGSHWEVWGLDGTWYEFGNTTDSTQKTSSGTYEWSLDKVIAPNNSVGQVRMMFIRYFQDSPDGGTTIRDAGIKQITYGYATSTSATSLSLTSGTVDFYYHAPSTSGTTDGLGTHFATAYGTNYNCSNPPNSTTMRCDDPVTYNSVAPPDVMPTLTLDSIISFVGTDTSNSNKAYRYNLTYQDSPYTTDYYDSYTLVQEAAAGSHLLTQITPRLYIAGTGNSLPAVVFGYTGASQNFYRDPSHTVQNGSIQYGGQTYWQYLNFYEDLRTGTGARIQYATARANMNGTPYITDSNGNVTDDRYDPLYCTNNANNSDTSKRCTGSSYGHPDDYSWSLQVVTQISALGTDSSGNTTVATTQYAYALKSIPSSRSPVSSCHPITGTGVPAAEADCMADSWSPGYDGSSTPNHDGNWKSYYDSDFRGFATVYITSAANNLTVDHYYAGDGWWTPESNGSNYNSGQLYEEDRYQGQSTLLETVDSYYTGGNVPAGNPYNNINSCNGNLNPIYNPCVVAPLETKIYFYEGNTGTNAPWVDTTYTYDDVNGTQGYTYSSNAYHNLLQQVTTGSNLPSSIYPITAKWTYTPDNETDANGIFRYDVNKATHSEVDDNSGHVWQCRDITYDEGVGSGVTVPAAGWLTTMTSYSTCGNSSTAIKSYTAYDKYGNVVATVDSLGVANPGLYSSQGCSVSTVSYVSAAWTAGHYTNCTAYDTGHTAGLPTTTTNALGQTSSVNYDYTESLLLNNGTDSNGQITSSSISYDSTGNETILMTAPGETGSYTSKQTENTTCTTSSALPCFEIDSNGLLYSNAISRTFYDAQGRSIETRTPGPTPGDDTVVAMIYNDQNNSVWTSVPFQVPDGSGWIDPTTAKDINGNVPAGSTVFYDALGRSIAMQDPNWGSPQEPGINCSAVLSGAYTSCVNYSWGAASGTGDTYTYETTTGIDADSHVVFSYADVSGNTIYTVSNTGLYGGTITPDRLTSTVYNALGEPTSVTITDEQAQAGQNITSVTATATYDDLGRQLTFTDPDQGTFAATYDPDGRVLSVTQTSGTNNRTVGFNYDLLGRVGCEQTAAPTINWNGACSAGNPLIQNTYDTTTIGIQGSTDFPVGHLTQSVATTYFPDGTSATVLDQAQHDQRGRVTVAQMAIGLPSSWGVTTTLPAYTMTQAYNDANQPTTTSTSANGTGYTFTRVYDTADGALQGLSNSSSNTANLATLAYNANALLSQINFFTSAGSAGLATEQFNYDGDLRLTTTQAVWASSSGQSGTLFKQTRTYDNASNVINLTTTQAQVQGQSMSGGMETENFCYDEQSRLLWAGNNGTQPGAGNGTCGSGTLSNTLNGAGYTSSYAYTNLGQLWQGPITGGSQASQYLYCDNSHPHQLTGIYALGTTCANRSSATAVYSASYDAWGNVTTRAYNNVTATLSYDTLNRMVQWSTGSAQQEQYVYDAGGERVLKRSTNNGTTTMTVYAFGAQELQYHGDGTSLGGTNNTYYYALGGLLIGKFDGTNTTFFITDGLGSLVAGFNNTAGSAAVLGNQTYEPYGKSQYQQGSMGTNLGYTGQQNDNLSGLDYYGARYYDPVAGIFLSPDSVQGNAQGMDPYAYVGGNPETLTDPTGHKEGNPLCPYPSAPGCPQNNSQQGNPARDKLINDYLNSVFPGVWKILDPQTPAQLATARTTVQSLYSAGLALISQLGAGATPLAVFAALGVLIMVGFWLGINVVSGQHTTGSSGSNSNSPDNSPDESRNAFAQGQVYEGATGSTNVTLAPQPGVSPTPPGSDGSGGVATLTDTNVTGQGGGGGGRGRAPRVTTATLDCPTGGYNGSGNFAGMRGSTLSQLVGVLPSNAVRASFRSDEYIAAGCKWEWVNEDGNNCTFYCHSPNGRAPEGSTSHDYWTYRYIENGFFYMMDDGNFLWGDAGNFSNATHIYMPNP